VLINDDLLHKKLVEGLSEEEFTLFEGDEPIYMKLKLKEQRPPLLISIKYINPSGKMTGFKDTIANDLLVYYSMSSREPCDTQHEDRPFRNVSSDQ
jgi:hypothetical protein